MPLYLLLIFFGHFDQSIFTVCQNTSTRVLNSIYIYITERNEKKKRITERNEKKKI